MIKQFFKKVLISYLIIICCIYTPTAQAASWSFGGYNFGNGSLNIVKDGVRITTAAVDSAPIKSNLATRILGGAVKSANIIGTISLLTGLALDAVDYVLDPANNTVKYKTKDAYVSTNYTCYVGGVTYVNDVAAACAAEATRISDLNSNGPYATSFDSFSGQTCRLKTYEKKNPSVYSFSTSTLSCTGTTPENPYRYLNPTNIADKLMQKADAGDADAQAEVNAVVADLVNQGIYDAPINQAIADAATSTPTDPTTPTDTQIDTSSITAAIQSLAKIIASASSNTADALKSVINTSIDKLLNRQQQMQGELVNVGSKVDSVGGQVVGVGDKVDNVGGKVVGVGDAVKDVGGKVVGLNDSVDKVGDKVVGVGEKVDVAGDKVGTKVDAVGDKVVGVGEKVDAAGDKVGTKVDAVGDKVTGVGDKVVGVGEKVDAAGEKTAEAIKESTKEITKKMDETKPQPFELPAFCSWASKVCDFIDWVKKDPDLPQDDNTPLVKDEKDSSFVDEYARAFKILCQDKLN